MIEELVLKRNQRSPLKKECSFVTKFGYRAGTAITHFCRIRDGGGAPPPPPPIIFEGQNLSRQTI